MSTGAHVNSTQPLEDLCLALSVFASECREGLEASKAEIERKAEVLEERWRRRARAVEYLQEAYDYADEDDDRSDLAYRLRQAEEEYQRAGQWLRKVEECAGEYARAAARVKEISDHRIVEACAFLRQKIAELQDYIALQPEAISAGGSGLASRTSDSVSAVSASVEQGTQQRLEELLGTDRFNEHAESVENVKAAQESLRHIPNVELVAIRDYTADGYNLLNQALWSQDHTQLRKYAPYIEAAKSGLKRLPDFKGTVYRWTHLAPEILANYRPGTHVTERAFTSATAATYCTYSGNVNFVINSRHGKDVSQIAKVTTEREVLFPPGTKFKILNIRTDLKGVTKIYMTDL